MSLFDRLRNVFRSERLSGELDAELEFHLAERVDELVATGMTEKAARAEALRRFGNYASQKEKAREMDMTAWLEAALGDVRQGLRQLRLNPGFATVAILSLALGVGANTAIFQLINALRLKSLPVPNAAQLAAVDVEKGFETTGQYSARNRAFTFAQYQELQRNQQAFDGLLAFGTSQFNVSPAGEVRRVEGLFLSANYLDVLGVRPMFGRGFTPEDDHPGCGNAGALLNYTFWQREYGGDPSVLGREIYVRNRRFPIVGITPPEFFGLEPGFRFDVALPLCADGLTSNDGKGRLARRDAWWLTLVGRLKPGWTVERASAHIRDLSPGVFRETVPPTFRPDWAKRYMGNKLRIVPASNGLSELRKDYSDPLWMLMGVTALVLLIACANLANLLLARASARQRELAVRQAIGASRWRLIGQLIIESMLLATSGAALGAVLAQALSRSLVAFLSDPGQPVYMELGVDWNVFAFTALLAVLTCLLFGLAPAIRATSAPPASAMQGGRGSTATAERNGLRRLLVVSQIALSLVLLVGALLFGRSLRNLLVADTGMAPNGVLLANLDARLPNLQAERRKLVFEEIQQRIGSEPGVISVAPVMLSPLGGAGWNGQVMADGTREGALSWFNRVGPGYFQTLKTPLMAGRDFTERDDASAPKVAIVNEEFAKVLFGGANPVGKVFRIEAEAGKPDSVFQVVGMVRNTKYYTVKEKFKPIAFMPLAQDDETPERLTFLVRTEAPMSSTMAGIRQIMTDMQSNMLVEFRVLDLQLASTMMRERLMANLSGGFGFLATLLSSLGLYGVISYMVARRSKEMGVRMALGARPGNVVGLVFGEAGRLLLVGLAVGLAGAYVASRYAESMLYGLKANDSASMVLGCLLLAATATLAAVIPARRATRIDPAVVLREE